MAFTGDVVTFGDQDTVLTGTPIALNGLLDARTALLRGGKIYLPAGGIFGILWNLFSTVLPKEGAEQAFRHCGRLCSVSAQVAYALQSFDIRKMDAERIMTTAASIPLEINETDARNVFDMIAYAQHGEKLVPDWRAVSLLELGDVYDTLLNDAGPAAQVNFAGDLGEIERLAMVNTTLAYITRLPRIAQGFSTAPEARDTTRRAMVLDRLSAIHSVAASVGLVARAGLTLAIFNSPIYDYERSLRYTESQIAQIKADITSVLSRGSDKYQALVQDAMTSSGTHLGKAVNIHVLPVGLWSEYFLQSVPTKLLAADYLGIRTNVPDVNSETTVPPQFYPLAEAGPTEWLSNLRDSFARICTELEQFRNLFDADPAITYALRDAGQPGGSRVREAVTLLDPFALISAPPAHTSDPTDVPAIFDIFQADQRFETIGDITSVQLVPSTFGKSDARDVARFMRGRTFCLEDRIEAKVAMAEKFNAKKAVKVVLPLPQSEIFTRLPEIAVPLPIWETLPSAYLGFGDNGLVKPATDEGLATILGVSVARMRETFEGLLHGPATKDFAEAIAYGFGMLGHILYIPNGKANPSHSATIKQVTNDLRSSGKTSVDVGAYSKIADHKTWGAVPNGHVDLRFSLLGALIQLDQTGEWFLAPFSYVPAPCDITRPEIEVSAGPSAGRIGNPARWPRALQAEDYLMANEGIGRILGRDMRKIRFVSVPAGRIAGSEVVLTMQSYVSGLITRHKPLRHDAADVMIWASESMLEAPSPIDLTIRPGAKFTEVADAVVFDATLAAEQALEL